MTGKTTRSRKRKKSLHDMEGRDCVQLKDLLSDRSRQMQFSK